jgi:CheY-like chemotaxis protein
MNILFIDNDLEDIELYREAINYINSSEYFANNDSKVDCQTLTNCRNVIEFLDKNNPKPDVIFLDINMPLIGGKECLGMIKNDGRTSKIPVVMLSTNCPLPDSEEFKKLGALDCIQKPNDFRKLVKIFTKFIFDATPGIQESSGRENRGRS